VKQDIKSVRLRVSQEINDSRYRNS